VEKPDVKIILRVVESGSEWKISFQNNTDLSDAVIVQFSV